MTNRSKGLLRRDRDQAARSGPILPRAKKGDQEARGLHTNRAGTGRGAATSLALAVALLGIVPARPRKLPEPSDEDEEED